jgi:small subunit ribosomal protein S6
MPIYETVFITRQDLGVAQVEQLTKDYSKVLTDNGGKILKTEQWGLRTFAYIINKSKKGHYTLIESDTPAPAVIEMERLMRNNEDIVRYMSIKLDCASTGPSAVIAKHDNDDRDFSNNTQEVA